jgi:ABC-type polysaccharide/polyol phosphate export permease
VTSSANQWTEVPDAPAPELRFRRRVPIVGSFRELWRARELVLSLAQRDIKSRYKQAIFGAGWAVVTPVLLMLVSTVLVQRVTKQDTGDAPYALFAYLGTLPWSFFNSSLTNAGSSLTANQSLLNKIYCPREIFPMASVAVSALDFLIATGVLGVLFVVFGFVPAATAVWAPLLLAILVAFTLGLSFLMSGLLVYLRDLRQALPMILQVGLFATPVFYGVDELPERWVRLYATLNPLVGVIDGLRRTVLFGQAPDWDLVGPGAVSALLVLVAGFVTLKRLETGFADVA